LKVANLSIAQRVDKTLLGEMLRFAAAKSLVL